jgi:uncharacterized protein
MPNRFLETVFTPSVRAEQTRHGSRAGYDRFLSRRVTGDTIAAGLTEQEVAFIAARDSFYLATVSATGWPHVQHRGGPAGFVRILDTQTLGWADFSGNRQYVTIGNAADNDRVAMIFMDYSAQRRLKVLGRMTAVEIDNRPDLKERLEVVNYGATIEHAMRVTVTGFDWNCPQHITPRYTASELASAVEPLRRQIIDLQALVDSATADRSPSHGKPCDRSIDIDKA